MCVLIFLNDPKWKKMQRNSKEEIGAKSDQKQCKQSKNKGLRDFATSAKLALRCEAISQPKRSPLRNRRFSVKVAILCEIISQLYFLLCENFRSCEAKFGTRVPLRNTGTPNSQLQNGLRSNKA